MISVIITSIEENDLSEIIKTILSDKNNSVKNILVYPEIKYSSNKYIEKLERIISNNTSTDNIFILTYSPIIMDCISVLSIKYSIPIKFLDDINGENHNPDYFYKIFLKVFQTTENMLSSMDEDED